MIDRIQVKYFENVKMEEFQNKVGKETTKLLRHLQQILSVIFLNS